MNEEIKPKYINYSYQVGPPITMTRHSALFINEIEKHIQAMTELIMSDDYDIIHDEYIQTGMGENVVTVHHLIAKRKEQ